MSILLCVGVSFGKFHQIGLDEIVQVAVHYTIYIRGLMIGAVVFYSPVIEYIASNLRTPFNFFLASFHLGLLLHAVLKLLAVEDGAQLAQGIFLVLGLVAGLGIFDENFFLLSRVGVGELVSQSYTGFNLVHILFIMTSSPSAE